MTRQRPNPMPRDEITAQNTRAKAVKTLGYDPWERWENEKHQRAQNIVDYLKENP